MEGFGDCLVSDNYPLTHVMENFQIYTNLLYCSSPNGVHVTYLVHIKHLTVLSPFNYFHLSPASPQQKNFHGCFRIEVELLPIQRLCPRIIYGVLILVDCPRYTG